ncbi:MAG: BrnA antitoxin family protein [Paracoccaceae bacterium]
MTAKPKPIEHPSESEPDDDIPDMSTPYWTERFAKAVVQRGRPKAPVTKISTTLRLDAEVVEKFREGGPGWQTRMNDALRKAAGL